MSTLHTVNGQAIAPVEVTFDHWFNLWDLTHNAEVRRLCQISWNASRAYAQADGWQPPDELNYSASLRDALALMDRLLSTRDDGWTAADVQRLAELRKLAGNG